MRRANIYVGGTTGDFLNNDALECQHDVTVNTANYGYFGRCLQPVRGQFFTIQNFALLEFDKYGKAYHGMKQCLNLCEVEVYIQGKDINELSHEDNLKMSSPSLGC